ncbi:putative Holliday junction resolvase [Salibacterium salarium]|uniref:Putative pre-16S rRNA nuclease n=1 Tax=Salibacterium salarium TaxID=284579 RepID=A0A3R9QMZ9_9BACI|nr:Holliday junction resolvase RuvX [Salibacterium salarium]MDQ0299808.1 putative Holliday junction resolvase [Salibacterium salarium]RSL34428.1 Holliday junction resolvase RuvX [Salibacterium salarium]
MRVLGLDVGMKRIGVAVSDQLRWTAQGVETIHIKGDDPIESFHRISELMKENEASEIVVGLPKNMNGTIGPRGEQCQMFADKLKEEFNVPVSMYDERLTTQAAERTLIEADMSRKKRKKVVDKMAAVMILQGYLDQEQSSSM